MNATRIGVVGLGRLLAARRHGVGWNRTPSKAAPLLAKGLRGGRAERRGALNVGPATQVLALSEGLLLAVKSGIPRDQSA